jgi:hypothetical protein
MVDDDSLPWGTLQCVRKLAGHRLLDWSFYALILVFPVIWYFIFGSWFKSQLGSLVSAAKGSYPDFFWKLGRYLTKYSVSEYFYKDRVWRWRRQALPVVLVVRCWPRSSIPGSQNTWSMNILCRLFKNKAPCLAFNISEPLHWKWKKKKVGLSSIIKTKLASTSSCVIPKCQSCEFAWARQRSPKIKQVQLNLNSEGVISCEIPKCQFCELAWA